MNSEIPTAFPWAHGNVTCTGMGLRDYFAAKAMQGFLDQLIKQGWHSDDLETVAKTSYRMADEMIKARGLA